MARKKKVVDWQGKEDPWNLYTEKIPYASGYIYGSGKRLYRWAKNRRNNHQYI